MPVNSNTSSTNETNETNETKKEAAPHVLVIGGGVIGVFSALALSRQGAQVTVLERHSQVAMETSFANAGRVCPTRLAHYPPVGAAALAKLARLPGLALKSRGKGEGATTDKPVDKTDKSAASVDVPSHVAPSIGLALWGSAYVYNCNPWTSRSLKNTFTWLTDVCTQQTKEVLELVSERLPAAQVHERISRLQGNLWLYASADQLAQGAQDAKKAAKQGYPNTQTLNASECATYAPFLSTVLKKRSEGGCVVAMDDFTVNTAGLTHMAAKMAAEGDAAKGILPVTFRTDTVVKAVLKVEDKSKSSVAVRGVELDNGEIIRADAVVVCTGNHAKSFIQSQFGLRLPIYPIRGFSVDLFGVRNGPSMNVNDFGSGNMSYQATPMNKGHLRLAGFADFTPESESQTALTSVQADSSSASTSAEQQEESSLTLSKKKILLEHTRVVLPEMEWESEGRVWRGFRPTTPDFCPIVGQVPGVQGGFLNVGHGALGLNMAAGTAHILASVVMSSLGEEGEDGGKAVGISVTDAQQVSALSPHRFAWF